MTCSQCGPSLCASFSCHLVLKSKFRFSDRFFGCKKKHQGNIVKGTPIDIYSVPTLHLNSLFVTLFWKKWSIYILVQAAVQNNVYALWKYLIWSLLTFYIPLTLSLLRSEPSFQSGILLPTALTKIVLNVLRLSLWYIDAVSVVPLFTGVTCSERDPSSWNGPRCIKIKWFIHPSYWTLFSYGKLSCSPRIGITIDNKIALLQ